MLNVNKFDSNCLNLAIEEAEKSLLAGNYPVGAVLAFDENVVAVSGNTGESTQNYINHAEAQMLIKNGKMLLQVYKDDKKITLYSTLEPCLMCLGIAVMNKVNRIVYLQKDPHAGACSIDIKSLGTRYQEVFPEIVYLPQYSPKPKKLIIQFLDNQIAKGIRVEWSQKLLKLLSTFQVG